MKNLLLGLLCVSLLLAASPMAAASDSDGRQETSSGDSKPQQSRPRTNVQIDLTITDTLGNKPVSKVVSMLVSSGREGSIRTSGHIMLPKGGAVPVQLNLDAHATALSTDLAEVGVTFEYQPMALNASEPSEPGPIQLRESIWVLLRSGQPLLVSRSADPATDRTVTVELTATIREP